MSRLFWLTPVLLLTACAPMQFSFDHDRSVDFRSYKTYAWSSTIPEKQWEKAVREDLMIRRVVDQVDRAMAARGFRKAAEGKTDFLVAFTPLLRSRMVTSGYMHYGWAYSETRPVRDAGIQLDVMDGTTKRVVWTGVAGGGFEGSHTPAEAEMVIGEAVRGLLAGFPPSNAAK